MEEQQKKKQAQEKINYIYQVLQSAAHAERKSGFHYIVWGTAMMLAMLAHYLFLKNEIPKVASYTWLSITGLATVLSLAYFGKEKKKLKVDGIKNNTTSSVSIIFHSFLFLILVPIQQLGIPAIPLIFMIYGAWLLTMGNLLKFSPLIFGGLLNWIMALSAIYISLPNQLLLGAIVCFLSFTLPGYLLNKNTLVNA